MPSGFTRPCSFARSGVNTWTEQRSRASHVGQGFSPRVPRFAAEFTEIFLRSIDPLRATHRLGPVLFQLPPYLRCDLKLLADFLASLPTDIRYSFEFRHASWLVDAVYELLQKHNVALCWAESEKLEVPEVTTADFAYFRLRKAEYPPAERKAISATVTKLLADRKDVFVLFN